MSRAKHNSYRTILEKHINGDYTIVYWGIVEKETSRTLSTRYVRVTVYKGSKHYGNAGFVYTKPIKLNKKDIKKQLDKIIDTKELGKACSEAYLSSIGGNKYQGTVSWFDTGDGVGFIRSEIGSFHFFACNSKQKSFKSGDVVSFFIEKDPHVVQNCGATAVESLNI